MKNVPLLSLCAFLAICVLRLTESSANAQLSDSLANGLRLHFAFNGNATDSSSNGFNGTLVGPPSFVPDEQNNLNSAISLNGLGQYVSFTDQVFGPNVDSFSFFARVNVDPAKSGGIVMKGSQNGEAQLKIADGNFSFQVNTGTRWEYATFPATSGYKSLVGTYTRNSNIQLWVDGELKQQTPITNGSLWSNSGFYSAVGAYVHSAGSFEYFDGVIDEVRIYDRALNSSEIKVLSVPADASDLDQDGVNYYRETADGTDPNDATSFNPLSKGLVAYYPFDGNANDDSGYGRNGIVYNASLTSDRVSAPLSAYSFVSASDKIEIPSLPNLSSNSFTISAWVYRTNSETFAAIFDQGLSSEPNSRIQLQFRPSSPTPWPSNSLAFCFWENDLHSDSNSALLFQWEHWLASFDSSTGLRTIYKDGLKVADDISETTQTGTGGTIGTFNDAAWPFLGSIDDVRFYARSLSADEVRQLFYSEAFSDTQKHFLVSTPSAMGHFSQAEYNTNRTNGQTDVATNPAAFNLFTQSQFDGNRTAGQQDVIASPMAFGLYDSTSIMDLHMGSLMIQKQGNNAVVSFQPQTTADLTQPYTNYGLPITSTITMPGDKGFIRIQARPYPTPSGTPPIH